MLPLSNILGILGSGTRFDHLSGQYCVVAEISGPGVRQCVVVSAYFQYRQPTTEHVERLEKALIGIGNREGRVIIGADVNAHSPWWHRSTRDDTRGSVWRNLYPPATSTSSVE